MERGLLNLVNYGHQDRFRHVIMCLTEAGEFSRQIKSDTCRVIEFHKKPGNDLSLPSQIAQAVRDHGISLLHARGWPTLLETALAARLAGIDATVYGFHGKTVNELAGIGVGRRLAQAIAIRSYSAVITLNSRMRHELSREAFLSESSITVIPNGVDCQAFCPQGRKPELRSRYGLPQHRLIVGNIARLDPVKNHGIILRALSRVSAKLERPYFLLVGDGEERTALDNMINELGLRQDVRMIGFSAQVAEMLNCMDIYVQSSFYEGFSNTILEAMACGLPVVSSDVGGSRDIVCENREGLFFDPQDEGGLVQALRVLQCDAEKLASFGQAARDRAVRDFSIARMVSEYETMYSETIK